MCILNDLVLRNHLQLNTYTFLKSYLLIFNTRKKPCTYDLLRAKKSIIASTCSLNDHVETFSLAIWVDIK